MSDPHPTIKNPPLISSGFVLLAAALWGTLGTLYKTAADAYGLTPVTIVFWRAGLAALGLGFALLVVVPLAGGGWRRLRVRAADWPIFITFGLLGVTAFYILYIYAVLLVGVAVSVVLLYTSPVFVAVLSWRFLGEPFRRRKTLALVLTLAGCILVARAYDPSLLQVNWLGILCGLGSGFTYALYSILGKFSLHRGYTIGVMSFYVYAIGALGLLAVSFFGEGGPAALFSVQNPGAWLLLSAVAFFATIGALYLYTAGLRHLQAGVASILATFEPVVAASLAFFVVGEKIEWPQIVGGCMIITSVLAVQRRG
jgi:DME family drug/metabolite transporter